MKAHVVKQEPQNIGSKATSKQNSTSFFQMVDNGPQAVQLRKLQSLADNAPSTKNMTQLQAMASRHASNHWLIQKKENKTGMSDKLKSEVESLSGLDMSDVKVHYSSSQPAQLNAHAYAQGSNIHIAPGQERHLPHEAWHVVQQKQGRVKATMQMKGKVNINDDKNLEKEADVMGAKAVQLHRDSLFPTRPIDHDLRTEPVQDNLTDVPVQRILRILNPKSPAISGGAKNYTLENVDDIINDIKPYINKLRWSEEYKAEVIERLKEIARHPTKITRYGDWATALQKEGGEKAKDLANIGIKPAKIGDPGSELEPFSYCPPGQVRDHLNEKFDEGHLPWTHNSSPHGLLGIMLTGVMAPGSEASVNFRYDIDTRYHQGVTIVMKPGLYECFKAEGAWIEDLYSQHTALGVLDENAVGGTGERMRKVKPEYEKSFLDQLTKESDFRNKQIEARNGRSATGAKVPIIASHNPQLRIPYVIAINHIDFVILTKDAWNTLSATIFNSEQHSGVVDGAKKFRNNSSKRDIIPQPGNITKAVNNLRTLATQGGIFVDGGKVDWAHEAGRIADRGSKERDSIREAARLGLEAGEGFGNSEIGENNSPKALGIDTFMRFQQIYYGRLAQRSNLTGKVAAAIIKGTKAPHLYEGEVSGLIGVNNCLINAICQGAYNRNATLDELTTIRAALNNVGQMMVTDPLTIDTIRQALGIGGRGIIVRYPTNVADVADETFAGENPIIIYHTGTNHFQHNRPTDLPYNE